MGQWLLIFQRFNHNFPANLFLSSAIEIARAAAEAAVTAPAVLHHLSLPWPPWPRPWPPEDDDDDEVRGLEDAFWLLWVARRLAVWLDLVTTVFQRFIVIVIWNNIKVTDKYKNCVDVEELSLFVTDKNKFWVGGGELSLFISSQLTWSLALIKWQVRVIKANDVSVRMIFLQVNDPLEWAGDSI